MTAPVSQTKPLSPVPSGISTTIIDGQYVSGTWNKWFVDLREKINVINQTLAAWSGISPVTGLTPGTYGDSTHYPVITINQYGMITVVTTQVSSGGGNPVYIKTASATYTILATDIPAASSYRGMIVITNASANQVKIDSFVNISRPVGSDLMVLQNGAGATTIAGSPGVTLIGPTIVGGGQYSVGRAIEISQDVWSISGNLAWMSGPPTTFYGYAVTLTPVAYWRMNETSGTTLADNIGGALATLSGSYTLNQVGMVSGGASVLFSGGYAMTTASATWALGTGDFSIFIFAKWTATGLAGITTIRDSGNTNILSMFFADRLTVNDAEIEGWLWGSGIQIGTGTPENNGLSHSICCTYVFSTQTLSFYFDGSLVGTKTQASASRPTSATMQVNIATNFGSQNFPGNLSELLLFNKALTSTQVTTLDSYRI